MAATLLVLGWKQRLRSGSANYRPAALATNGMRVDSWAEAVRKIKEDRSDPAGKGSKIDIPEELRHYSDKHRFLAIQLAEVRKYGLETPRDLIDLAAMIKRGEMVAVDPVTDNYVLYGVGDNTDTDPFSRYEDEHSVSIYDEASLKQQYDQLATAQSSIEKQLADLQRQMSALKKRNRSQRASLQAQINAAEKQLAPLHENKALLEQYYGRSDSRQKLFSDYASLQSLSQNFRGQSYNISDPADRRNMKVSMLSSLRPEAVKILEEVASAYRQSFDRPLPVSSLVRPDEYQHELHKVNRNAILLDTPPHSTGLAFDIDYHYMPTEEQNFLMSELAQLKDEGRIEVLRENLSNIHVFAFIDGARPDEQLIAACLEEIDAALGPTPVKESHHAEKKAKSKAQRDKHAPAKPGARRRR